LCLRGGGTHECSGAVLGLGFEGGGA
jgi:hypothetical protein